ncbi:MAG: hypothetical protein KGL59_10025 [Acidobacteriota bacterium]|nr:hypothetical protein [Acidobacteriota bacterium]
MGSLSSFPPRSTPPPAAGRHRSTTGRPEFSRLASKEAADSGPIAQAFAGLVLLLIWLLVFFLALWPVWSGIWARLAAAALR